MIRLPSPALLTAAALLTLSCGTGRSAPAAPQGETPKETPAMASPASPCYRSTELAAKQMRIDCANGHSFVVRQGEDGKWREEAKARAGALPDFASLDEAARSRCGCS